MAPSCEGLILPAVQPVRTVVVSHNFTSKVNSHFVLRVGKQSKVAVCFTAWNDPNKKSVLSVVAPERMIDRPAGTVCEQRKR